MMPIDKNEARAIAAAEEAAWAAVHQARRGVGAAWVGVVVNALIVAAALLTPYYQRTVDARDATAKHADLKAKIITDLKREIQVLADATGPPAKDPDPGYSLQQEDPIRAELALSRQVRLVGQSSERHAIAVRNKYYAARDFPDLIDLTELISSSWLYNQTRLDYLADTFVQMRHPTENRRQEAILYYKFVIRQKLLPELRLNLRLNTDNKIRTPLPGDAVVASCEDPIFAARCMAEIR